MMKSNIGHLAVYTRYTINRCAGFYSAVCADISQEVTKYHVANRGGHPIRVKINIFRKPVKRYSENENRVKPFLFTRL